MNELPKGHVRQHPMIPCLWIAKDGVAFSSYSGNFRTDENSFIMGDLVLRMLSPSRTNGNWYVSIKCDNEAKRVLLARATYVTWSDRNLSPLHKVIHIDHNKSNNHCSNLKALSPKSFSEQMKKQFDKVKPTTTRDRLNHDKSTSTRKRNP